VCGNHFHFRIIVDTLNQRLFVREEVGMCNTTGRGSRGGAGPRVAVLPVAERSAQQRDLLEPVLGDSAANLFGTLVRHPNLYAVWQPFCLQLLQRSAFGRRERELIILRTAWLCAATYEWRHHLAIGRRAGLSDNEIRQLCGVAAAEWSDSDAALLAAVEQLYAWQFITRETWRELSGTLSTEQLVELPMLVGHYVLLAGVLNSLAVELDPDVPVFDFPDPDVPVFDFPDRVVPGDRAETPCD
jgi:4-carboxymuconolactone decarboxylase